MITTLIDLFYFGFLRLRESWFSSAIQYTDTFLHAALNREIKQRERCRERCRPLISWIYV